MLATALYPIHSTEFIGHIEELCYDVATSYTYTFFCLVYTNPLIFVLMTNCSTRRSNYCRGDECLQEVTEPLRGWNDRRSDNLRTIQKWAAKKKLILNIPTSAHTLKYLQTYLGQTTMADTAFRKIDIDLFDEDTILESELYEPDPRNPSMVLSDAKQKQSAVRSSLSR